MTLLRPSIVLAEYGRRYPNAWRQIDEFRAAPPIPWPTWCFLPLAGAWAIVSGGKPLALEEVHHVAAVGALAAWRASQGVYLFHGELADSLWRMPVDGRLPCELFEHLPEWCPYILFDVPRDVMGFRAHGFWVHLEHDTHDGNQELRLLLDTSDRRVPTESGRPGRETLLVPFPLHMGGTLADAIKSSQARARQQAAAHNVDPKRNRFLEDMVTPEAVAPLVSTVLYLCAQNAEVRGPSYWPPPQPELTKTKRGPRLFPPSAPTTWEVGYRIGAAIGDARARAAAGERSAELRAGPRPHIRRAHWHLYWTGPRDAAQTPRLHWLAPMPINAAAGPLVATVRPVLERTP
jgi:hypothetical protein